MKHSRLWPPLLKWAISSERARLCESLFIQLWFCTYWWSCLELLQVDTYWLPGISTFFCVWRVLPVLHYKRCKCQAQVLVSHSPLQLRHEHMTQALPINIQKAEIMAYGLTTSWKIGGETVETVSDFIFGGSKITVDGHCNHEIKRCLLLGRKLGLT